jgi:hypothetical protein
MWFCLSRRGKEGGFGESTLRHELLHLFSVLRRQTHLRNFEVSGRRQVKSVVTAGVGRVERYNALLAVEGAVDCAVEGLRMMMRIIIVVIIVIIFLLRGGWGGVMAGRT